MYTAYVARHATGIPSPGGYGLILALRTDPIWEQDDLLERITPHKEHLIAVREALARSWNAPMRTS